LASATSTPFPTRLLGGNNLGAFANLKAIHQHVKPHVLKIRLSEFKPATHPVSIDMSLVFLDVKAYAYSTTITEYSEQSPGSP
jgi:hypothetical protein